MNTPFGADWDDLDLETLGAFLGEPVNEGLTWEAKGGHVRPEHVRNAVCAFGNSDRGGYLVIGATQARDGAWSVEGFAFPDEPEVWIANSLGAGGVDPIPSVDVRAWTVSTGVWVAVVQVFPVAITPCLTSAGEVWQRLSGKSQRVIDAATLRGLFERGEAARQRATMTAADGRGDLARSGPGRRTSKVVVSLASPILTPDISAVLFRKSTYDLLLRIVSSVLSSFRSSDQLDGAVTQETVTLWNGAGEGDANGYAIRVSRSGSVAIALSDDDMESGLRDVALRQYSVQRLWSTVIAIMQELGATGPVAVSLYFFDHRRANVTMERWSEVRDPTDDELASIEREATRALGRAAWEPE